jgi:LysM repeat protein
VTNSATASGAGQTSAPATVTIANLAAPITQVPPTTAPPSNWTQGSTQYHRVAKGEWLIQIVRCWGATYSEVLAANPQITDPDLIYPADFPNGTTVTVPHIGSAGKIYGPPCVVYYTVQGGGQNDNWDSIALRYNACLAVLQKVNPVTLAPGTLIKIPINSGSTLCGTAIPPAVPPVVTTAAPPANTVMRITFDAGQTTAARVGIINPNETLHYVVNANQGQMLHIKLTAPANEVAIGVNVPTGLLLKPLDASPEWSALVTTGGDHYINMTTLGGGSSKSYTLEVSLTAPAATNTPGP